VNVDGVAGAQSADGRHRQDLARRISGVRGNDTVVCVVAVARGSGEVRDLDWNAAVKDVRVRPPSVKPVPVPLPIRTTPSSPPF
jgi:hypothetical protein